MRPRKVSWVFRQLTRARHFFHSVAHRPSIPDSGEGLEPVRQLSGAQRCPACPDPGPCHSAEPREPPREKWRAVFPRGLLCWKTVPLLSFTLVWFFKEGHKGDSFSDDLLGFRPSRRGFTP